MSKDVKGNAPAPTPEEAAKIAAKQAAAAGGATPTKK
jgi:hypothetical protein